MGRVYAAAVIMPQEYDEEDTTYLEIKDSKKLSPKKRERLREYIEQTAIAYGVGYAEAEEIDETDIYKATMKAMHRALDQVTDQLSDSMDRILVDGEHFKPYYDKYENYPSYSCIVRGDGTYLSIAAASILAKCARDASIADILKETPEWDRYGWSTNKGYGTKAHMEGIRIHGITPHHRFSFKPCQGKKT